MIKKQIKTPDTYIIIFCIVIVASILTYIIPQGKFDTKQITYTHGSQEKTKTVLVSDSFKYETDNEGNPVRKGIKLFAPYGEIGFLNYAFEGLVSGDKWSSAVGVVVFILLIGGAFGIIIRTGAIEAGLLSVISKTKGYDLIIISVMFILFSLAGAVFGMAEETIPVIIILIPIMLRLGYDSVTTIMICFAGTQIGFATSWMNPFSVAVAQGIATVPILSGAWFRLFMWGFFTLFGLIYTVIYSKKIKANPQSSISYETDLEFKKELEEQDHLGSDHISLGHFLVLGVVILGIVWVMVGVIAYDYYIPELAVQFFVMGIVCGIIGVVFKLNQMTVNDIPVSFRKGAGDLLGAALVVGMAKGIVLVLGGDNPSTPSVLNTILYTAGNFISSLPSSFSAWFMYLFQTIFNFFVVSGSGQAALTMPLMAPLSDIAGISRQVSVVAFQLGDGFTNLIVPTSAVLMAILGVAKIEWLKWLKFQFKFQLILFFLGSLFVLGSIFIFPVLK